VPVLVRLPHIEGGRNPLKRFNDSLDGLSDHAKRRFFRDNFIDLLGSASIRRCTTCLSLRPPEVTPLRWRDPPLGDIALPGGVLRLTLASAPASADGPATRKAGSGVLATAGPI